MKVVIFPTSDRLGQASAIKHYHELGHQVYVPRHGTLRLDWTTGAQWPSLLCKDPETGGRNLEIFGLRKDGNFFGEDSFVETQDIVTQSEVPAVRICSEEEFNDTDFDVYHSLRGAESYLNHYQKLLKGKKTVWVSSTLNVWNDNPSGFSPKNIARILPAPYEKNKFDNSNVFDMWCLDIEYDLLGLPREEFNREEIFASFNHNFHVRQPEDYRLFCDMNEVLEKRGIKPIVNYGGNVRAMGADIRYSNGGPVGNYETLSPLDTIKKYKTLRGVVHFKQTDWGGGVFFHALFSHTPIITTKRYVDRSNASKYLIDGENSIHVNTAEEAADAVETLLKDEEFKRLSSGMRKLKEELIGESYWRKWELFLSNLKQ